MASATTRSELCCPALNDYADGTAAALDNRQTLERLLPGLPFDDQVLNQPSLCRLAWQGVIYDDHSL
jgi:hypothetical protein